MQVWYSTMNQTNTHIVQHRYFESFYLNIPSSFEYVSVKEDDVLHPEQLCCHWLGLRSKYRVGWFITILPVFEFFVTVHRLGFLVKCVLGGLYRTTAFDIGFSSSFTLPNAYGGFQSFWIVRFPFHTVIDHVTVKNRLNLNTDFQRNPHCCFSYYTVALLCTSLLWMWQLLLVVWSFYIVKGFFRPKMKFLSWITNSLVVPSLYTFLRLAKHRER